MSGFSAKGAVEPSPALRAGVREKRGKQGLKDRRMCAESAFGLRTSTAPLALNPVDFALTPHGKMATPQDVGST